MIVISNKHLIIIITLAISLFIFLATLIFISFIYYTKRKFDSIIQCSKNISIYSQLHKYNQNQKQFNDVLKEFGLKSNIQNKINKIIRIIIKIFNIKGSK